MAQTYDVSSRDGVEATREMLERERHIRLEHELGGEAESFPCTTVWEYVVLGAHVCDALLGALTEAYSVSVGALLQHVMRRLIGVAAAHATRDGGVLVSDAVLVGAQAGAAEAQAGSLCCSCWRVHVHVAWHVLLCWHCGCARDDVVERVCVHVSTLGRVVWDGAEHVILMRPHRGLELVSVDVRDAVQPVACDMVRWPAPGDRVDLHDACG